MGQVHSAASQAWSTRVLHQELPALTFAPEVIFDAIETHDVDAMSRLLDASRFDLTEFDDAAGDTVLHRAIALGRDDITGMLLCRGENDPRILNLPNRRGYTPLMLATALRNVPVMQALINAGGHVGNRLKWTDLSVKRSESSKDKKVVTPALMLIEAQGDVSKAFELSVQYRKGTAAVMFFKAGASAAAALQQGEAAITWLFTNSLFRAEDVFAALDQANTSRDEGTLASLTQPKRVLRTLDMIADRDDKTMVAALGRFISAGACAEDLLSAAVSRCVTSQAFQDPVGGDVWLTVKRGPDDLNVVRLLVSLDVSIASELERRRADTRSADMLDKLISFRAAAFGLEGALRTAGGPNGTGIDRAVLAGFLQSESLSDDRKLAELSTLFRGMGPEETDELARRWVRGGHSLDDVRLFLRAGAAPDDRLLMSLAVRLSRSQDSSRKPVPLSGHRLMQELMQSGADSRSAIKQLLQESDAYNRRRLKREATISDNAARIVMRDELSNLLGAKDLSNAEKVATLKQTMSEETRADAAGQAGDLLWDSVSAGHWHTVKLLALAEVPATKAFVNLSQKIREGETGAKFATGLLVRHGADFRPAMAQLVQNIEVCANNGEHGLAEREQDAVNALALVIASELAPLGPSNPYGQVLRDQ